MGKPTRSDQYSVSLSVDGVDYGIWETFDGGDSTSEETKHFPGGMQPEISLGGQTHVSNVTINRLFDGDRDGPALAVLRERVGKGRAVVTKQPLDADGNAYGQPEVYGGKLMTVTPPPADANATGTASLITVVISTEGSVG
jgi:hypothetical protein